MYTLMLVTVIWEGESCSHCWSHLGYTWLLGIELVQENVCVWWELVSTGLSNTVAGSEQGIYIVVSYCWWCCELRKYVSKGLITYKLWQWCIGNVAPRRD